MITDWITDVECHAVTAMLSEQRPPPPGGWTTDDLDELPVDGRRRELIDGVLIVLPPPTCTHQTMCALLGVALLRSAPQEFEATQGVEVRISRRCSLTPDVLVTSAAAAAQDRSHFFPHEVELAVEIVSPASRVFDRFAKPALYAEAGIPFFWRIETADGIEVHTHRLDPAGRYVETGLFTTVIDIEHPWPIKLPISRFTPRHMPSSG
jgi:Uma2 family endonuclease